jgi:hypothetical protein
VPQHRILGFCLRQPLVQHRGRTVNVWLQSRSLPARGRVGLEVHRCLCIIDAGNVFISTVMGLYFYAHSPLLFTGLGR